MKKPTVSQERNILRGVVARMRVDLEYLIQMTRKRAGKLDEASVWGLIERLDKVMTQFGIERENPRRMPW